MFRKLDPDELDFWVTSCTWGIIMTAVGFIISIPFFIYDCFVKNIKENHGYCVYFRVGKNYGGFSLGPYCFISENASRKTIEHEQGHSLQNCLYGPFMVIFSLCSVIRYHYRNIREKLNKPCKTDYDSFWFEGQATKWGHKLFNNALNVDNDSMK